MFVSNNVFDGASCQTQTGICTFQHLVGPLATPTGCVEEQLLVQHQIDLCSGVENEANNRSIGAFQI